MAVPMAFSPDGVAHVFPAKCAIQLTTSLASRMRLKGTQ